MDEILINRIKLVFEYHKQLLLHKDIFDPVLDEYIINEYALSAAASELDADKDELRVILNLNRVT